MLLNGATLLAEPCPYCSGVRVLKDGDALCVSCGAEPARAPDAGVGGPPDAARGTGPLDIMKEKLQSLSEELAAEADHRRQQDILDSIRSLTDVMERLKRSGAA